MIPLTREALRERVNSARIKPRLRRILRYVPEEINDWEYRDFLVVMDRARHEGVLIYEQYTLPFTLTARAYNAQGRTEAIICDLCATWRRGTESAVMTFPKGERAHVSHLVCADLECSLHVRGLTNASRLARTQIREQITPEGRVNRLRTRVINIITNVYK